MLKDCLISPNYGHSILFSFCYNFRIQTKGKATVDRNMPVMSGQLRWASELKGKMSFSVKSFKELNHPICYREGAKLVFKKYKETMGQLITYEDDVFQMWNLGISKKMTQSLNRSLIIRNTDKGTLKVNFARELSSLLREVRFSYVYFFSVIPL